MDDLGNRNEMKAGKKELGFDSVDYAWNRIKRNDKAKQICCHTILFILHFVKDLYPNTTLNRIDAV